MRNFIYNFIYLLQGVGDVLLCIMSIAAAVSLVVMIINGVELVH